MSTVPVHDVDVREARLPEDRAGIIGLILEVWLGEDPYRSMAEPEPAARAEIERSFERLQYGAVAVDGERPCGVALVAPEGPASAPTLT